jgi:hypothetical protein
LIAERNAAWREKLERENRALLEARDLPQAAIEIARDVGLNHKTAAKLWPRWHRKGLPRWRKMIKRRGDMAVCLMWETGWRAWCQSHLEEIARYRKRRAEHMKLMRETRETVVKHRRRRDADFRDKGDLTKRFLRGLLLPEVKPKHPDQLDIMHHKEEKARDAKIRGERRRYGREITCNGTHHAVRSQRRS